MMIIAFLIIAISGANVSHGIVTNEIVTHAEPMQLND